MSKARCDVCYGNGFIRYSDSIRPVPNIGRDAKMMKAWGRHAASSLACPVCNMPKGNRPMPEDIIPASIKRRLLPPGE